MTLDRSTLAGRVRAHHTLMKKPSPGEGEGGVSMRVRVAVGLRMRCKVSLSVSVRVGVNAMCDTAVYRCVHHVEELLAGCRARLAKQSEEGRRQ